MRRPTPEKFIKDIARQAGDAVLKRFGKDGVHYSKSKEMWDVVTKADLMSEKIIIDAIRKNFPDHGILAEEGGGSHEGSEYVWIIDPIDGTLNFSRKVPMFGVMICFVERGEVVLSVIYMPAMGEFFFAKKGKGAFLNGKRIQCSQKKELDQSYGTGSAGFRLRNATLIKNIMKEIGTNTIQFGSFGAMSANVALVAAGRRDWIIPLAGAIWDFAPASLILQEAGCTITDTKGNPWKLGMIEMVAANPTLHKELLTLTADV